MKHNINIAEILKDKPAGTNLWSMILGKCTFLEIGNDIDNPVRVKSKKAGFLNSYSCEGRYYNGIEGSECVLFPSKEMRDWTKFAWKKGVVLINDCEFQCIFKEWASDDYTMFNGRYYDGNMGSWKDVLKLETANFYKLNNIAYGYFREIKRMLGEKFNLETLEIEMLPEFKDGDIVVYGKSVAIFRKIYEHTLCYYVSIDEDFGLMFGSKIVSPNLRLATDSEKQQLFNALEKRGMRWDAEKKQIVNLKPKADKLKPFDKVLVKDEYYGSWEPAFFWKEVDVEDLHPYMIIGGKRYRYCEPYEGNENLLDY